MATAHSNRCVQYFARSFDRTRLLVVFVALLFLLEDVEVDARSDDDDEELLAQLRRLVDPPSSSIGRQGLTGNRFMGTVVVNKFASERSLRRPPIPVKFLYSNDKQLTEDDPRMSTRGPEGSFRLAWEEGSVLIGRWYLLLIVGLSSAVLLAFVLVVWFMAQMSSSEKKSSGDGGSEEAAEPSQWICHPVIRPTLTEQCEGLASKEQQPCTSSQSVVSEASPEMKLPSLNKSKLKGLLERRGSSASLTIDLGHQENITVTPTRECTTEEYLLSVSNVLTRQQLRSCLRDVRAIHREFWDLPLNHPDQIHVPGSWAKNRYRTVIPNESSRVRLNPTIVSPDNLAGYINANYIRGYDGEEKSFIATQGPMTNTVNDMWEMAWTERAPVIVMITKLFEKSRSKCEAYLPTEINVPVAYNEITVTITSLQNKDGYTIRNIHLQKGEEIRKLVHFWFDSWPDHKTPANAHSLLSLAKEVEIARFQGVPQRRPSAVWLSSPHSVKEASSPVLSSAELNPEPSVSGSVSPSPSPYLTAHPISFEGPSYHPRTSSISYESSPSKKRTRQSADYEKEQKEEKGFFRSPFPAEGIMFRFGSPRPEGTPQSEVSRDDSSAFDFDIPQEDPLSKNSDVLWKLEKLSTNSTASYDTAQSPGWSFDKSCKLSVDCQNCTAESPLTGSDRSPFRTNSSFDSPALSSSGSKRCQTQSSGESSVWTADEDSPVEAGTSPRVQGPISPALLSPRWLESNKGKPAGPVIVHCSAGIGRTGCFIAICIGVNQLLSENCVDILGMVCRMRYDRGGMVQTAEQYEFIHRALAMFERSLPDQSGE
ncbi:PTPc [Nesidiocoris tenuis]|uniref:protein-tyrosine-phosphatase n=1 Tax=Nesidiocoris tenuis TaxID=355587 RepID=A0ABN7AI05_9HEMI|nr:PTPc [Nesidiocoris tenuis]